MTGARTLALVACAVLAGCALADIDLAAKTGCPCAPEFECVRGVCRPLGQVDDVLPPDPGSEDAAPPDPGSTVPDAATAVVDAATIVDAAMVDAAAPIDAGPMCPVLPAPPTACPAACTGGCNQDLCTIECSAFRDCMLEVIACPSGWRCVVDCSGELACSVPGQIACADGECEVRCSGAGACGGAAITCGAGPCRVLCDPLSAAFVPPVITCGESCTCSESCTPPG